MSHRKQQHISEERYNILVTRYRQFVQVLDQVDKDPVRVFDPVTPKQAEELLLIREVSQVLQSKKEEDVRKSQAKDEEILEKEEKEPVEPTNEELSEEK